MRTFYLLWLGQLVSLLGSSLTRFGIGVWGFERTGSVTHFSLLFLAATLPELLLSLLAGRWVDRWPRRRLLLLADGVAGVATLTTAVILLSGITALWPIYLLVVVGSAANAVQWPAYEASIVLLVPREALGKTAGLRELGGALDKLLVPLLAAALLGWIGLAGMLLLDLATFLFGIGTLLLIEIPTLSQNEDGGRPSAEREDGGGAWGYLRARRGLGLLFLFSAVFYLLNALALVLIQPLILSLASTQTLGLLMSVAGGGALLGSLLMSVWGGPKRRVRGFFYGRLLVAVGLIITGWQRSVWAIGLGMFVSFSNIPIAVGSLKAFLQASVPPELQGRVFASYRLLTGMGRPVGYLLAAPLVALMQRQTALSTTDSMLTLFLLLGLIYALVVAVGLGTRAVRALDSSSKKPSAAVGATAHFN